MYFYKNLGYPTISHWNLEPFKLAIKLKKTRSNGSTSSASRVSPVRRCQALSQSCTSAVIGGFTPLNLDPAATWTQIPWSRSLYHWSITNGKGAHRVLFFLWNDGCLRCSTLVVWETPEIYVFFYLNQFQLSKDGSIVSIFISIYKYITLFTCAFIACMSRFLSDLWGSQRFVLELAHLHSLQTSVCR